MRPVRIYHQYSKMSDAEIGRRVAAACKLDGGAYYNGSTMIVKNGVWATFDPCNNPADTWPIIVDNKITIHAPMKYDEPQEWLAFDVHDSDTDFKDINPLRAAMIVFLLMQESANVQGNPA